MYVLNTKSSDPGDRPQWADTRVIDAASFLRRLGRVSITQTSDYVTEEPSDRCF